MLKISSQRVADGNDLVSGFKGITLGSLTGTHTHTHARTHAHTHTAGYYTFVLLLLEITCSSFLELFNGHNGNLSP